jgi:hypothetical protein
MRMAASPCYAPLSAVFLKDENISLCLFRLDLHHNLGQKGEIPRIWGKAFRSVLWREIRRMQHTRMICPVVSGQISILEHFQAKWAPLRVKKMRQNKKDRARF